MYGLVLAAGRNRELKTPLLDIPCRDGQIAARPGEPMTRCELFLDAAQLGKGVLLFLHS
ncbi:hypothetical protein J6TS7_03710 [Paenibacillus dendritiformis]|nr:hypothetical protein J6TS7_03710 [Paenibacillus dendritiformis]